MSSAATKQSAPSRYCSNCGYVLDGLPENRCPECGRPFDPDDPRTFRTARSYNRWRWHVLLRPSPLGYLLYFLLPPIIGLLIFLLLSLLKC
jgi:predicted amidophosphoribosyltransferase